MAKRLNKKKAKTHIDQVFSKVSSTYKKTLRIPSKITAGKLYEIRVLAELINELRKANFKVSLNPGTHKIYLKASHGPINTKYPFFNIHDGKDLKGKIWTDVEIMSLSYFEALNKSGQAIPKTKVTLLDDQKHELDILIADPNAVSHPTPEEIILAVECKNTEYSKRLLREALGMRRELSFLGIQPNSRKNPISIYQVRNSRPASLFRYYCTDSKISNIQNAGFFFDIEFIHFNP